MAIKMKIRSLLQLQSPLRLSLLVLFYIECLAACDVVELLGTEGSDQLALTMDPRRELEFVMELSIPGHSPVEKTS